MPPVRTPALKHFNGFYETGCLCAILGLGRKYSETASGLALPAWADSGIRVRQVGEHGGFPLPYTEMFLGCTVLCVADLAVIQKERVYMCHMLSLRVKVLSTTPTWWPQNLQKWYIHHFEIGGRWSQHPEQPTAPHLRDTTESEAQAALLWWTLT